MGASLKTEDLKQLLSQLHQKQQLGHAYLFTGSNGAALMEIVHSFIHTLLSTSMEVAELSADDSLTERIKENQYADVMYLYAEGQTLKVEQIRNLREWLISSPVECDFKVGVIVDADKMNSAASNSLLTFLEEPVDNVYLILLTREISHMLPTILSRVQQYHIQENDEMQQIAELVEQGIRIDHAKVILALAADDVSRLVTHYNSEVMDEWLSLLDAFYMKLFKTDVLSFVHVQLRLKPYLSVQGSIDNLNYLLWRNHQQINNCLEVGADEVQYVQQPGTNQSDLLHLFKLNDYFIHTKQLIQANVNPQLAFEALTIQNIRE